MNTKTIQEGTTKLIVPEQDEMANYPPTSAEVFYNRRMEINRDITVAAIAAFTRDANEITYADVLAATGALGVRVANETPINSVMLNDWSPLAYEMIQGNIELNNLENAHACNENASSMMARNRYNIVDIDPFGSPVPFLSMGVRSATRLLCITATDTAPLCGAHYKAGVRRYGALPLNTEYHSENGLRILLGKAIRELASHDKAGYPLLSFSHQHFFRVFLRVEKGASKADECIEKLGFISHCSECGHRISHQGLNAPPEGRCASCGSAMKICGPLYPDTYRDASFCSQVLKEIYDRPLGCKKEAFKLIELCRNELDAPPYHYDYHRICKDLGVSPAPMGSLLKTLRDAGFNVSRTHFSGTSFKTDAGMMEIKDAIG